MKTHIMRLAVQDLTDSTIRLRALRLGQPLLWLLYQELLWRLYQNGGYLRADPEALVDEVNFFTAEQIREFLPLLRPLPGKKGGIHRARGRIWNERVLEELTLEQRFRNEQAIRGRRGGRARAQAIRQAVDSGDCSGGQATAKRSLAGVKPAVSVSVPLPLPYPSPRTEGDRAPLVVGGVETAPGLSVPPIEPQRDQRGIWIKTLWEEFCSTTGKDPLAVMSSAEWDLACRWCDAGLPLATVLAAMADAPQAKTARTLLYFKAAVEQAAERRRKALS